jgi:predicted RNA binding protein YcfA (HicA-like mRNA interferase family)
MIHIMRSADLIKDLERAGWMLDRVRGSHHVFRHANNPNIITVLHPRKDLGKGLVSHLRKLAGLQ